MMKVQQHVKTQLRRKTSVNKQFYNIFFDSQFVYRFQGI